MRTILCVDNDQGLADLMRYALARAGFRVLTAQTGSAGLALLRAECPDLIILDLNLPDMRELTPLIALRCRTPRPIVVLAAHAHEDAILAAFAHGADDYIVKPFSLPVLLCRLQAILRRAQPARSEAPAAVETYRLPGAVFHADRHQLMAPPDVRIRLTPTEGRILRLLLAHAGQVLPPEQILERLWGYENECMVGVIKTHIRHLRAKLARLPDGTGLIQTRRGIGYTVPRGAGNQVQETTQQEEPPVISA